MVKVKRPLFSQDATGKLGSELQIQPWKDRHVIGRRRRPKQPRTEAQQAHRILMGFLATQWKLLNQAARATWTPIAQQLNASNYNAFISENMARYRNIGTHFPKLSIAHATPTKIFPATEAGTLFTLNLYTVTGGDGYIQIDLNVNTVNDAWGYSAHHTQTHAGPCSFQNLVAMIQTDTTGPHTHRITGLEPGLYRIAAAFFCTDGKTQNWFNRKSAIVTPSESPPPHAGPPDDEWPPPWPE